MRCKFRIKMEGENKMRILQDESRYMERSPRVRPTKSAPLSPAKPIRGGVFRTRSESFNLTSTSSDLFKSSLSRTQSFHVTHKVPVGDSPYVRAKNIQLVEEEAHGGAF